VPFEDIGRTVGRNRLAARQLASRARRPVHASPAGRIVGALGFTITNEKITEVYVYADPVRRRYG